MTAVEQRTHEAVQDINRKFNVTLRDLFAMSAMNALLQESIESFDTEVCYKFADAMLEARKK